MCLTHVNFQMIAPILCYDTKYGAVLCPYAAKMGLGFANYIAPVKRQPPPDTCSTHMHIDNMWGHTNPMLLTVKK